MATTVKSVDLIRRCLDLTEDYLKFPLEHVWIDYDQEADVLYLSFRKPQRATKTIETDNDILIRKDGDTIVGITVMDAATR